MQNCLEIQSERKMEEEEGKKAFVKNLIEVIPTSASARFGHEVTNGFIQTLGQAVVVHQPRQVLAVSIHLEIAERNF